MENKPRRGRPVTTGRTTKLVRVPIAIEKKVRDYIKLYKEEQAFFERQRKREEELELYDEAVWINKLKDWLRS